MVCAHCKIEKEVDEFPFRKARNNYSTICKKCKNLYSLKYRKENVARPLVFIPIRIKTNE